MEDTKKTDDEPMDVETEYAYEVASLSEIDSGIERITGTCEEEKHERECEHFRQYESPKDRFIFYSSKMCFEKTSDYWEEGDKCDLCNTTITEPKDEVLNLGDMCTFHSYCLCYYLHNNRPTVCPGCDKTRCRACWACSY